MGTRFGLSKVDGMTGGNRRPHWVFHVIAALAIILGCTAVKHLYSTGHFFSLTIAIARVAVLVIVYGYCMFFAPRPASTNKAVRDLGLFVFAASIAFDLFSCLFKL